MTTTPERRTLSTVQWLHRNQTDGDSSASKIHTVPMEYDVQSQWLPAHAIKPALSKALSTWSHGKAVQCSELSAIRHEIWLADSGAQTLPMTAMASSREDLPLGFLCGYPRYHHRCFFISEIALCPDLPAVSEEALVVATSLVEAAIDESQQMGCHGWVACDASSSCMTLWRELGFSRYDDFTYRRMGYF